METAIKNGTYAIDASHTEVNFKVRHLGLSNVRGSFAGISGEITLDSDSLESLQATATIDVSTINTKNEDRDNHLRSADFFDAENHPQMTFSSKSVSIKSGNAFALTGDLTIRGVTKEVVLESELSGMATDPWGNEKIAFSAETVINRKDFGLVWNQVLETGGLLVGEEVTLVLDVQAAYQG